MKIVNHVEELVHNRELQERHVQHVMEVGKLEFKDKLHLEAL